MNDETKQDVLQIVLVPLSQAELWDDNPKLHDLGGLAESFRQYGFRDAPIFDSTLGQIAAGNGRIETLRWMKDQGEDAPRGIPVRSDGEWLVPVQVGVDAADLAQARAFAVDHNNLTMSGGNFSLFDIARMWDPTFADRINEWANQGTNFITMDRDDLAALERGGVLNAGAVGGQAPDDFKEYDEDLDTDYRCPKCGYEWSGKEK